MIESINLIVSAKDKFDTYEYQFTENILYRVAFIILQKDAPNQSRHNINSVISPILIPPPHQHHFHIPTIHQQFF